MSFATIVQQDARLRILQALSQQTDHRLSDIMLGHALDAWGIRRSRDYVRTQVRGLAEVGAVTIREDTTAVMVAEITQIGLDHVLRRTVIDGVKRPEPGE